MTSVKTAPSTEDYRTKWFLAQFKPNSHKIAERNLTRQGFWTFITMQEEVRPARGEFRSQMRPLFPGYVFVALDLLGGGWRAVNSTYGLTRLMSLGKKPTPVPLGSMSEMMLRCDREGKLLPPNLLKPGDEVMLKARSQISLPPLSALRPTSAFVDGVHDGG